MPMMKFMALTLSAAVLTSCASKPPPFDSNPPAPLSAKILADRAAVSKIKCNGDPSKPLVRIPPIFPIRALRTGRTNFIFDLEDSGTPINIRIIDATEEIFVRPTVKAVEKWKYAAKMPGEAESKRKDICSRLTFRLQDERGRVIPMWTDIEAKNETYQKYKKSR